MPLIILGLIVIISIAAYWYIGKQNSDEPVSPRDIGGKFSNAAQEKAKDVRDDVAKKIRRRAGIYDVDYEVEDDDNTIEFPSDVERAKRKRNIH